MAATARLYSIIAIALLTVGQAWAFSGYEELVPNGTQPQRFNPALPSACILCHAGPNPNDATADKPRNPFGIQFCNPKPGGGCSNGDLGFPWRPIAGGNPDGDGRTNAEELCAQNCDGWSFGDTNPACPAGGCSNPGFADATATFTRASTATPTRTDTPVPTRTNSPVAPPTATHTRAVPSITPDAPTVTRTRTPTFTPTRPDQTPSGDCAGDCNGSGAVEVNELVTAVNIVLGQLALTECESLSPRGTPRINDVVRAVNNALNGCP